MMIPENNYLRWLTSVACVVEIHKKFPAIEFTTALIQHSDGLLKGSNELSLLLWAERLIVS